MTVLNQGGIVHRKGSKQIILRVLLFSALGLFCLYYTAPLLVMIATSVKSLSEIRSGSLISLPQDVTFEAWSNAWESACAGVRCNGMKPYVWNSVEMVVPAVVISTTLGAWPSRLRKIKNMCV